jgi:hypothetical protein
MESAGRERGKEIGKQAAEDQGLGARKTGPRCRVPGVRFQVSGVRFQVPGVRFQASGFRCPAPGARSWKTRFQVSGSRCPELENQISGDRFQMSAARRVVAWAYYAARLLAGCRPPGATPEECAKRGEEPGTGQAAERIKRQRGMRLLPLDPRLSTSRLREIEGTKLECL